LGARGGGIYTRYGAVTLTQSTLSGNSTEETSARGGGIFTLSGAVTLTQSTLSGNSTAGLFAFGGGINTSSGAVTLTNSTLSGNSTTGRDAYGGGIWTSSGAVTLTNSTLTGNSTAGDGADGGGIFVYDTASNPPLTIQNSIVAGNTTALGTGPDLLPDPNSTLTVNYSLIGVADFLIFAGNVGNLVNVAPLLGPLANNGGPTMTHAPLAGSPAVNAGDPGVAFDPDEFDQRGPGFPRVVHGRIDIGAYEAEFDVPATLVVATLSDNLDGDLSLGNVSLREALWLANLDPDHQTITFASALSGGTILLHPTLGELVISREVTIDATGLTAPLTIDAQQQSRVMNFIASTGDLSLSGLTLTGGRTTGSSSSNVGGGIRFASNGTLALTDSTLTGNSTAGNTPGGGIYTSSGAVTLTNSTLSGNSTAGDNAPGGGIFTDSGAVTLTNSTLSGNSTAGFRAYGGGISTSSGAVTLTNSMLSGNSTTGTRAYGGGISTSSGAVTLTHSTLSGNSTTGGLAWGGGIGGNLSSSGAVTLINSTLTGNSTAGDSAWGGGIFTIGAVTLINSTLSGNSTAGDGADGGGIFVANTSANPPLTIQNSIVADNTVALGTGPDLLPDPDSALTVNYSLIGTGITPTAGDNNVVTNDPLLAPLAFNGGPTWTHALLPGSPALDAGDPDFDPDDFDPPLVNDQRGAPFARVVGGRIDIGAFELQSLPTLVGDYNLDGVVNAADYTVWRDTLGSTTNLAATGDDSTGVIDEADYDVWAANFGAPLGAGGGGAASSFAKEDSSDQAVSTFDAAFASFSGVTESAKSKRAALSRQIPNEPDNDALLLLATALAESDRDGEDERTSFGYDEESSEEDDSNSIPTLVAELLSL
jgi:hypothetical protein